VSLRVDLERALYSMSLRDFIRGNVDATRITDDADAGATCAWDIMEPGTRLDWGWHLDAVCEHLDAVRVGEIADLVINIPPRTLKTTAVTKAWPAHVWASKPATKFLTASYGGDLAIDHALGTRDILRHPWYQRRWPIRLAGDQDVKSYYKNTVGGYRVATSPTGRGTGYGGDIQIIDDPINVRDGNNRVVLDRTLKWWTETMPSRRNDPRTARRVVVMQRVAEDDVAGWCIEHGWTHLNLPNEYNPARRCITVRKSLETGKRVTWKDPRGKAGDLLFPTRLTADVSAELKKTLGSYAYAGQYNQEPAPDDGSAIFPAEQWGRYRSLPVGADGKLRVPDDAIVSWDMTFTGKARPGEGGAGAKRRRAGNPDFVVGALWYRYGAETYRVDEVRGQWSFVQAKAAVMAFDQRCRSAHPFPPRRHVVEAKANGEAILSELRPVVPGLVGFNPDPYGDKLTRAWAWQPRQEAGQVWLPAEGCAQYAEWVAEYVHELRVFPNGRNDDRVDESSQAHLVMRPGSGGWVA